jgi:hypothetical protein
LSFPAPAEITAATGIVSFEVRFEQSGLSATVAGFTAEHQEVASFTATLARSGGRLSGVFSRNGKRIESEIRGEVAQSGQVDVHGEVGGHAFQISGGKAESEPLPSARVYLSDEERHVLQPWVGLSHTLQTVEPVQEDLCQSCLLVGAVVVQSATLCVDGDAGACSVLIDSYALFQGHCDPPPCT